MSGRLDETSRKGTVPWYDLRGKKNLALCAVAWYTDFNHMEL